MYRLLCLLLAACLSMSALAATPFSAPTFNSPFGQSNDIPSVDEAMPLATDIDDEAVHYTFKLMDQVYLYRPQFDFIAKDSDGNTLTWDTPVTLPTGTAHQDDIYGATEVYFQSLSLTIPLSQLPSGTATLDIAYQGCLENRLCYPPQVKTLKIAKPLNATTPVTSSNAKTQDNATLLTVLNAADANLFASWATQQALGYVLLLFFIGGLLMAFTPCVFPMFPILLSILAGSKQPGPIRGFFISLAYVLGMAIPFTLAGLVVALSGAKLNLQLWLQQPLIIIITALIFALLAAAMFGLFDLQAPRWLRDKLGQGQSRGSLPQAAVIGAISGLVVSPCITPVLAGSLLFVAADGNALTGASALFALSLGMGVPLLIIGAGGASLLPKAGSFMEDIKRFFGLVLLLMAIWLLGRIFDATTTLTLYGVALFCYALLNGLLDPTRRWRQALSSLLFLYALLLLIGAAAGGQSLTTPLAPFSNHQPAVVTTTAETEQSAFSTIKASELATHLARAQADGRPVLVDFFADWCVACKELERDTLSNPQVLDAMKNITLLRVDITATNSTNRQLMQTHHILGLPALLFFDTAGNEITQARVLGYMSPKQWLKHMKNHVMR